MVQIISANSQFCIGIDAVNVPNRLDVSKTKTVLGWNPQKTSFPELVKIMVKHDMKFVKKLFIKAQMDKEDEA